MAEVQQDPIDVEAADGMVLLSAQSLAGTLTPKAARQTARRLIEAANAGEGQASNAAVEDGSD